MYRGIPLNFPHILRTNGLLYTLPDLYIPFCVKAQCVEITAVAEKQRTSGFTRKFRVLELIVGVEPTTSALRMLCSAIKLYQQTRLRSRCSAIKRLSKERSRLRSRFPTSRQRRVFHREPYISASRSVNITERRLLFNYFLPISQRLPCSSR